MLKIDWEAAPDWAKYVAMDADGEWYFYEKKPELHSCSWNTNRRYEYITTEADNWDKSLQERPEND